MMEDGIAHAREQGFESVRLCQDSFNMRSLALYASPGFDTKEPLAYLALSNAGAIDGALRPATKDDLPAMDELCKSIYQISRGRECEAFMNLGFPISVLERGHIRGYLVGGPLASGADAEKAASQTPGEQLLGRTVELHGQKVRVAVRQHAEERLRHRRATQVIEEAEVGVVGDRNDPGPALRLAHQGVRDRLALAG